jgi:hypothetical protein
MKAFSSTQRLADASVLGRGNGAKTLAKAPGTKVLKKTASKVAQKAKTAAPSKFKAATSGIKSAQKQVSREFVRFGIASRLPPQGFSSPVLHKGLWWF